MKDQIKVMFARFPGGGVDRAEVTDWLVTSVLAAKSDPRIDDTILNWRITDTPITMGRNRCIKVAQEEKVDFLVMVDNDMAPDLYWEGNPYRREKDPMAKSFFTSSFDFLYDRRMSGEKPAVIGAPYCGPPPHENVYVFQWSDFESGGPEDNPHMVIEQYTREQAATMFGIHEAAALPTGLVIIDMDAVQFTDPPYFYYEWEDETASEKASTEDVTFTRDLSLNGVPQFCNWDSWAGHWKQKCVGRPKLLLPQSISERFRRRVLCHYNINSPEEKLIFMKDGRITDGRQADNGSPAAPEPAYASLTPDRAGSPGVQ
jgi:hypothetical protein